MPFDKMLAEVRFGCGLRPGQEPPRDAAEVLARLTGPDRAAEIFPIPQWNRVGDVMAAQQRRKRQIEKTTEGAERKARLKESVAQYRSDRRQVRRDSHFWTWAALMRRAHTTDGFRERLVAFWADHFTAVGKIDIFRFGASPCIETYVRPHVAGRFADLLVAALQNPLMLMYLDQVSSVGPNSRAARQNRSGPGLNENLAREVLELHTLGVDGPYDQTDVREFAELLTGLTYRRTRGVVFERKRAEPGAETVLGKRYGGDPARLDHVLEAAEDLSVHPATAHHIARKLVVHFLGDTPDRAVVDHVAARFLETRGDLPEVYAALLEHPASWRTGPGNIKTPLDFLGSAMRALEVRADLPVSRNPGRINTLVRTPLALMGQKWEDAPGPDGWPEEDAAWMSPQRLAARLRWAWNAPGLLREPLPDPRAFLETTLGPLAPEELRRNVGRAGHRTEGIALVLVSPAFQRM